MAADATTIGLTGNPTVNGLLEGEKWTTTALTYSFPTLASQYGSDYSWEGASAEPSNGFVPFTATQQAAVQRILALYAQYIDVSFTQSSGGAGDLRFGRSTEVDNSGGAFAWGYYPGTGAGGDVWFQNAWSAVPTPGTFDYLSLIHEIGHTLGLKHPFETSTVGATTFPTLSSSLDGNDYTVMSYDAFPGAGYNVVNYPGSYPETPMLYDVQALQALYGANFSTQSGDTVYSWSPSTGEEFINGVGQGAPAANKIETTLWDGGGFDTYDFSNYTVGMNINLNPGQWVSPIVKQNSQVAQFSSTDFAPGIIANAFEYNGNPNSLIEAANGGSGDDVITGNDADNLLLGNDGADLLSGGAGPDTLYGGSGNDTLLGGDGGDALFGDAGADSMAGGPGNDLYSVDNPGDVVVENPGEGYDEIYSSVSYTLPSNVETLFLTGSAVSATGNGNNDALIGDDAANVLTSGTGAFNFMNGLGGDDLLIAGPGHVEMMGGAGDDTFRFASPNEAPDFIYDFTPGQDKIELNAAAFGISSLLTGTNFVSTGAPAPTSAGPTVEYSTQSGYLFYDADGTGAAAPTVIALLNGTPDLQASDITFY